MYMNIYDIHELFYLTKTQPSFQAASGHVVAPVSRGPACVEVVDLVVVVALVVVVVVVFLVVGGSVTNSVEVVEIPLDQPGWVPSVVVAKLLVGIEP